VASVANLAQALLKVIRNKGAPGVDGQTGSWRIPYDQYSHEFNVTPRGGGPQVFACALGFLEYKSNGIPSKRSFAVTVQLNGDAVLGVAFNSAEYDIELEAGRFGYRYELPIQNYMLANCVDMFRVNFSSNRSASFLFDVTVRFSDSSTQ
jgi:hypothetical protein